ncbi:uncharacterized protein LOC127857155 [Dreissena polymorpha]|uniref:Mab-21-like HhH/H2TH-like domain-containing protein n=1 Tax=Dreissena polymorpha TaxID=45954 RepID=A0A9D3Z1T9_DREPO|nr:uncharacterized protein LOC127857155 [Dreissena polymorpha]KAH3710317.1 hypothetical protein DPMN_069792 [Dreissena polymorpha]
MVDNECFHFGSQSEGTTTPGLQSDIDILFSNNGVNIMTVWEDWKAGLSNLLMIWGDFTPPQQYLLQVFNNNTPEPESCLYDARFVMKASNQILFSSERFKQTTEEVNRHKGKAAKSGPSVSSIEDWDIVQAFAVRKHLPEIQHWIDRRRGRWPSPQLLHAARVTPCFLVPANHPESDYKREEWRLSPNLLERMLVFSFNIAQIKCYIVLKMIKKSLFSKLTKDTITSFHCKTIVFYTIERSPYELWTEDNLAFLVLLCLKTLRKWLQMGVFPHYIIPDVNLFDGKLSRSQQLRLLKYIDSMIKNDLHDIFHIDIDNLGEWLRAFVRNQTEGREIRQATLSHVSICLKVIYERYVRVFSHICNNLFFIPRISKRDFKTTVARIITVLLKMETGKEQAFEFVQQFYAILTSLSVPECRKFGLSLTYERLSAFRHVLDTDVASSHLKMASVLYCSGNLHSAVKVLEDVDMRYKYRVKAVCGQIGVPGDRDLDVFKTMVGEDVLTELPFALCVRFVRQEAHCCPYILRFEMNRNTTEEEIRLRNYIDHKWMNCVEVDARPFLYYLQYLTYGGLCEREKQLQAMNNLERIIFSRNNHGETDINMIGHCHEMEGDCNMALKLYTLSLSCRPANNAANWHFSRIVGERPVRITI